MEHGQKKLLVIIGIAVILLLGMYLWKALAVRSVEKKLEAQRLELTERSQKIIDEQTRSFLRLAAIPLVWTIRQEMIRDNMGQINDYLISYVREPGIKQILIAKPDGVITAATNKKHEGLAFSSLYPADLLDKTDIHIAKGDQEGQMMIVAPLMGYNEKMGTLVVVYESEGLMTRSGVTTP